MSADYEYQDDDYGGRILWGRVAFFGITLVVAFVLGTCVAGGDAALQAKLDEQEGQVMTLRAANSELERQLAGAGAGGDNAPADTATPSPPPPDPTGTPPETAPDQDSGDATTTTTYTVQPNDTLYAIAQTVYGDGTQWQIIADANNLTKDDHIRVGQELRIPPKP